MTERLKIVVLYVMRINMSKKLKLFAILWLLVFTSRADEGMWIPSLLKTLNESDMKSKGLKISIDQLYSVNQSSIKDGIVHFGGGCTGEIVSYEGLLFTNHHCGLSQIQSHSSLQNDYLKNGFWAASKEKELRCNGLTASIIVKIEDVTSRVMQGVDFSTSEGNKKLQLNIQEVEKEASQTDRYHAEVRPFNYGNAYFLIVKEIFKDIRLVGAPPQAIGNYGGDTDNWMWPRHTGDFSIFRIYANKNNEPAEFAMDNVPYKPRFAFTINVDGVKENDFTMVYGFPGRTQQFLTSFAIEFIQKYSNPAKIKMRDKALEILEVDMKATDLVRIQYAAKQSRISNSHKKWKGELLGLARMNVLDLKKSQEAEFKSRLYKETILNTRYGTVLENIENLYRSGQKMLIASDYFSEFVSSGPEMVRFSYGFQKLIEFYSKDRSADELKAEKDKFIQSVNGFYKNFNQATDRKLFTGLLAIYLTGTDSVFIPSHIHSLNKKYKGDWNKVAEYLYTKSVFCNQDKLIAQISSFGKSTISGWEKDPFMLFSKSLYINYKQNIEPAITTFYSSEQYYMHRYVDAMAKVYPNKKMWYDANGTLRVAYGVVEGSKPKDGMKYEYYTTTTGILEKYYSGNPDYALPEKLVTLLVNKDFGAYANNGELRTCFTASNQTTGGNSGSPVLNGYGELIGINFDRSWESTMSDLYYAPDLCRNIAVDIRYVLFIIEKLGNSGHLIKEMKVVNSSIKQAEFKIQNLDQVKDLNEQLLISPDNPVLLTQRAQAFLNLEMFDDARLSAKAAIESKSNYLPATIVLCKAHERKNEPLNAVKTADAYLKKEPNNVDVLFIKATNLFSLARYDEVLKVIGLAEVVPQESEADWLMLKARSLFMLNRKPEACSVFDKAKKAGSNVPGYYLEICN